MIPVELKNAKTKQNHFTRNCDSILAKLTQNVLLGLIAKI